MKIYEDKNCSPEQRADALLKELSLDEKIAQVTGMMEKTENV